MPRDTLGIGKIRQKLSPLMEPEADLRGICGIAWIRSGRWFSERADRSFATPMVGASAGTEPAWAVSRLGFKSASDRFPP